MIIKRARSIPEVWQECNEENGRHRLVSNDGICTNWEGYEHVCRFDHAGRTYFGTSEHYRGVLPVLCRVDAMCEHGDEVSLNARMVERG